MNLKEYIKREVDRQLREANTSKKQVVKVDWNDMKSIKAAEKKKTELENLGYTLVNTVARPGSNISTFYYTLNENITEDKTTLYGSSATLDGIKNIIAGFYYSTPEKIVLEPTGDNTYSIQNGSKKIDSLHVVKKGKRFRFESK